MAHTVEQCSTIRQRVPDTVAAVADRELRASRITSRRMRISESDLQTYLDGQPQCADENQRACAVTNDHLTAILAQRAMGRKVTPDRIIKADRAWIPRWRFQPLTDISDAFELIAQLTDDYSLTAVPGSTFTAEIRVQGRTGTAVGKSPARTITLALARALGLEVEE